MPDMSYPCGKPIGDTGERCARIHTHKGECSRGPKAVGGVQFYDDKHERRLVLVEDVETAKQIVKASRKGSVANH